MFHVVTKDHPQQDVLINMVMMEPSKRDGILAGPSASINALPVGNQQLQISVDETDELGPTCGMGLSEVRREPHGEMPRQKRRLAVRLQIKGFESALFESSSEFLREFWFPSRGFPFSGTILQTLTSSLAPLQTAMLRQIVGALRAR